MQIDKRVVTLSKVIKTGDFFYLSDIDIPNKPSTEIINGLKKDEKFKYSFRTSLKMLDGIILDKKVKYSLAGLLAFEEKKDNLLKFLKSLVAYENGNRTTKFLKYFCMTSKNLQKALINFNSNINFLILLKNAIIDLKPINKIEIETKPEKIEKRGIFIKKEVKQID